MRVTDLRDREAEAAIPRIPRKFDANEEYGTGERIIKYVFIASLARCAPAASRLAIGTAEV